MDKDYTEEIALIDGWFKSSVPTGSVLEWGDHHGTTGKEFIHTGWVDVQIPKLENSIGWGWVWTVVAPDDDHALTGGWTIVRDFDTMVWRNWDKGGNWWDDSNYVLTGPNDTLTDTQREQFSEEPTGVPGWSTGVINAALREWCEREIGRPDVSFIYNDSIQSSGLSELLEDVLVEEADETYEIAPGILMSSGVFDSLLSRDPEEAAEISAMIVETMAKIKKEEFPEL